MDDTKTKRSVDTSLIDYSRTLTWNIWRQYGYDIDDPEDANKADYRTHFMPDSVIDEIRKLVFVNTTLIGYKKLKKHKYMPKWGKSKKDMRTWLDKQLDNEIFTYSPTDPDPLPPI